MIVAHMNARKTLNNDSFLTLTRRLPISSGLIMVHIEYIAETTLEVTHRGIGYPHAADRELTLIESINARDRGERIRHIQ